VTLTSRRGVTARNERAKKSKPTGKAEMWKTETYSRTLPRTLCVFEGERSDKFHQERGNGDFSDLHRGSDGEVSGILRILRSRETSWRRLEMLPTMLHRH
jgi:hypothetical protein